VSRKAEVKLDLIAVSGAGGGFGGAATSALIASRTTAITASVALYFLSRTLSSACQSFRFCSTYTYFQSFMFSRLSQVSRHLSRPLPQLARASSAKFRPSLSSSVMAGASATQQKGLIHTAACLIIGDEVLGGKVSCHSMSIEFAQIADNCCN
jgi:hypothetical protein